MVAASEEWPAFQLELRELKELRNSFPNFALINRSRDQNGKAYLLAWTTRLHKSSFSFISTFVPYWFIDTDHVFT